jgi:tripartite-type tricarboxylate transporter receptor subunit TctC
VLGPKGLPGPIVTRWNGEVRKATKVPDLRARLAAEGFDIADSGPEIFQAVLRRDVEKWTSVARKAGVSAN